jgi:hypothetical protein
LPSSRSVLVMLSLGVPLLIGCTGQIAVRDVTTDKFAYLHSKFSLPNGPTGAVTAIKAQDSGTLPFQRITFDLTGHVEVGQVGSTPPTIQSQLTVVNAGGPFVETLEEVSSNGIPTREEYALRYRGLVSVREQSINLNQTVSSWIWDIKSLKTFTPLATDAPGTGSFDEAYETGNPMQIAGFRHLSTHCTYGATYQASKLNPKLSGDAQDMACEFDNQNGVAGTHSVVVLLKQYGITITKRNETAAYTTNITVDSVRFE